MEYEISKPIFPGDKSRHEETEYEISAPVSADGSEPQNVVKRKPQYARQALAGVFDVVPGIISLAGMTKGVADWTMDTVVPTVAGRGHEVEKSFGDYFDPNNNSVMATANRATDFVNKTVGVDDPEGLEQLARISSILIPTPAVAPKLVGHVPSFLSSLMLPLSQITKGVSKKRQVAEYLAQVGLTLAADQGIRYASDQPMAFSDPTNTGEVEFELSEPVLQQQPDTEFVIGDPVAPSGEPMPLAQAPPRKKDNTLAWLIAIGTVAAGGLAAQRLLRAKQEASTSPFSGIPNRPQIERPERTFGDKWYSSAIDAREVLPDTLKRHGASQEVVDKVQGLGFTDPLRQAEIVAADGIMPVTGKRIPSFAKDIDLPYSQLSDEQKQVFNQGMVAMREKLHRIEGTYQKRFGDSDKFAKFVDEQIEYHRTVEERWLKEIDGYKEQLDAIDPNDLFGMETIERRVRAANDRLMSARKKIDDYRLAGDTGVIVGKSGKTYNLHEFWGVGNRHGKTAKEIDDFLNDVYSDYRDPMGLRRPTFELLPKKKELAGSERDVVSDAELDAAILKMKNDPATLKMARAYGQITKGLIDHGVDMGVFGRDVADSMKKSMTFDDLGAMYIPGREFPEEETLTGIKQLVHKTAKAFGLHTTAARDLNIDLIGNMNKRAEASKMGIQDPIAPIEMLNSYMASVFNQINKSKAQGEALDILASTIAENSNTNMVVRHINTASEPYMPRISDESVVADLRGKGVDVEAGMITIQRNGNFETWYVSDPNLRQVLEMSPRLINTIPGAIGKKAKDVMTVTTTRNPAFAPIQFLYSMQQTGIVSTAHGVRYTPLDAIKGMTHVAATNVARETAAIFRRSLAEDGMLGRINPTWADAFASRLEQRVSSSFYETFNRETGGSYSQYTAQEGLAALPDLTKRFGQLYKDPSKWKIAWRYLDAISTALQDGATVGLQMRLAGKEAVKDTSKLSSDLAKMVNQRSKNIQGDFRAVGSSTTAQMIANHVPWSGAILNSYASYARAFKTNPLGFTAGVGKWVVIPTILEYLTVYLASDDETKKAYSNRYSDYVMSSNFVVPTGDASAPMVIPLEPSMAPLRAATLAAMDSLFGYSNDYLEMSDTTGYGVGANTTLTAEQLQQMGIEKEYKHMMAIAFGRALNIPIPPLAQAAVATTGNTLYIGPPVDGEVGLPVDIRPLGGAEQISGMGRGQGRYPDGVFDRTVEGVIAALFGLAGNTAVQMSEAFDIGSRGDPHVPGDEGSVLRGASEALQAGSKNIIGFMRVFNPLNGYATLPNSNDAIEERVRLKKDAITQLKNEFNNRRTAGMVSNMNTGLNFPGDGAIPSDDPVMDRVLGVIGGTLMNNSAAPFEAKVSDLQKALTSVNASAFSITAVKQYFPDYADKPNHQITPKDKIYMQEQLHEAIKLHRAMILAEYIKLENLLNAALVEAGGEETTLEEFTKRPSFSQIAPTPVDGQPRGYEQ